MSKTLSPSDGISALVQTLREVPDPTRSYRDDPSLPDCFRAAINAASKGCDTVAAALHMVKVQDDEQAGLALDRTLDDCRNKGKRLHDLFSFCSEGEPTGAYSRYIDYIRRQG